MLDKKATNKCYLPHYKKAEGDTDATGGPGPLVPQHEGIPTWILVTGGALAATAIVFAIVEIVDDDEDTVSPSSSKIRR